jgi:hypothetical protein
VLFVWCVDCGEFIVGVKTKTAGYKQITLLCLTYEYVKEQCSLGSLPYVRVIRQSLFRPSFCSEQAYYDCDLPVRGFGYAEVAEGIG